LNRRKSRRSAYKKLAGSAGEKARVDVPARWDTLAKLGHHGDGFPVTGGNAVTLYHEGRPAFEAMLEAIKIVEPELDAFYGLLTNEQKARFNQLGAGEG
jgi:cardiolipin synthase